MIETISDIQTILVVDDNAHVRESFKYQVIAADRVPMAETGPRLGDLGSYLSRSFTADAAISDHHLTPAGYASFNGAELVAAWYRRGIPGVLCTRYERVQAEVIRPHRRWIPSLLTPDQLNPDSMLEGLGLALGEIRGTFVPARRPWRAQVHFLEADEDQASAYFIEIPGWEGTEVLRIRADDVPAKLRPHLAPGLRCFAMVNLGAEDVDDLFVTEWEWEI